MVVLPGRPRLLRLTMRRLLRLHSLFPPTPAIRHVLEQNPSTNSATTARKHSLSPEWADHFREQTAGSSASNLPPHRTRAWSVVARQSITARERSTENRGATSHRVGPIKDCPARVVLPEARSCGKLGGGAAKTPTRWPARRVLGPLEKWEGRATRPRTSEARRTPPAPAHARARATRDPWGRADGSPATRLPGRSSSDAGAPARAGCRA